jgi:Protein of unknown function (DUF742)
VLSRLGGGRMADCDRRCRCRSRAGMTGRPLAAGIVPGRVMACPARLPGRRSRLRRPALALVSPVLAGQGDPRMGRSGDGAGSSLVRPYAVTGGRTKPRTQLEIEAMVAAAHYEARDLSVLSPECQAILGFCRDWRSVAEISAVLRMPLGVARILIADMAVEGLVRIHQLDHAQGRPDLNLLERVLSGLRKL